MTRTLLTGCARTSRAAVRTTSLRATRASASCSRRYPTAGCRSAAYTKVDIQVTTGSIASLMQGGDQPRREPDQSADQRPAARPARWSDWQDRQLRHVRNHAVRPRRSAARRQGRCARRMAYAIPYNQIVRTSIFNRGEAPAASSSPSAPEYTPAWVSTPRTSPRRRALMAAPATQVQRPLLLPGTRPADRTNTRSCSRRPPADRDHRDADARDTGRALRRGGRPAPPCNGAKIGRPAWSCSTGPASPMTLYRHPNYWGDRGRHQ